MSLRITKSTDAIQVKNITACIYAVPGVGKTTLGFTANAPLLLDFDNGSYRAGNRGDVVQVESWNDVMNITQEDLSQYKTLIVDTAGRALDALTATIIADNPKLGRGGSLTLPGFGELKSRFIAWTKLIRRFGLDVLLISHSEEKASGDDLIERLDMQGASKNEIYKCSDLMGRLYLASGKRMLNFSPTDTAFGKNPTQLSALTIPDFSSDPRFLAGVFEGVKAGLNKMGAEQQKVAKILADWNTTIGDAKSVGDFNELITKVQAADESVRDKVKLMLIKASKSSGFVFDKKEGLFAAKAAA